MSLGPSHGRARPVKLQLRWRVPDSTLPFSLRLRSSAARRLDEGRVDVRDAGDGAAGVAELATLPQREAETIACVDVVGLDTATTARALGINAPAVRVARHRGLRRLRRLLAAAEAEPQPTPRRQI